MGFTIGRKSRIGCEDRKKGNSILAFPNNYVILDIETTGYDPFWDDIIEICAVKCINHQPIETLNTLIRPTKPIADHITDLTGISNDMVMTAPSLSDILPQLNTFLGDGIILGQCVYFDINFIHDAYIFEFGKDVYSIENDYVDLRRLAQRFRPGLENYKLSTIAKSFGIDTCGAHRADIDCNITHLCYQEFKQIADNHPGKEELLKEEKHHSNAYKLKALSIKRNNLETDESHPLYSTTCVFTGKLEKFVRKEAMQVVVDIGGFCGDTVTKNTNFLILGDYDYCKSITDGKSSKHKKAEKLKAEGYNIEIISESVFYDMIIEHQ